MSSNQQLEENQFDELGSEMDLLTKLQNETLDGTDLSADTKTLSESTPTEGSMTVHDAARLTGLMGETADGGDVEQHRVGDDQVQPDDDQSFVKGEDIANGGTSPDEHITSGSNVLADGSDSCKPKSDEAVLSTDVTDDSRCDELMDVEDEPDVDVNEVIRDIGELNQIADPTLGQKEDQIMDIDKSAVTETGHRGMETEERPVGEEQQSMDTESVEPVDTSEGRVSACSDDIQGRVLTSGDGKCQQLPAGLDEVDAIQTTDAAHCDKSESGDFSGIDMSGSLDRETDGADKEEAPNDCSTGDDMLCVSDAKQEVADDQTDRAVSDDQASKDNDKQTNISTSDEQKTSDIKLTENDMKNNSSPPEVSYVISSDDTHVSASSETADSTQISKSQSKEGDSDEDVSFIGEETLVKGTSPSSGGQESIVYSSSSVDKSIVQTSSEKTKHCCLVCNKVGICKYNIVRNNNEKHLCDDACFGKFRMMPTLFLQSDKAKPSVEESGKDDGVEIIQMTPPMPKASTTAAAAPTRRIIACGVCNQKKPVKHEVSINRKMLSLCSEKCFTSFRQANKLSMRPCGNCAAYCIDHTIPSSTTEQINFEGSVMNFCGTICLHAFKTKNKRVMFCSWCKQKKSNFDMVEQINSNNKKLVFCSLNCLSLYRVNLQATSNQDVRCDQCAMLAPAQYHLTMSDASIRNFCSYPCVINFQSQFGEPNNARQHRTMDAASTMSPNPRSTRHSSRVAARQIQDEVPVISDVVSLAQKDPETKSALMQPVSSSGVQTHIIVQPPKPRHIKNKALLCKPLCQTKATSCRPHMQTKSTQTDSESDQQKVLLPVPVPIYIPTPMAMYAAPQPYPIPIPVPIPVPCFIPTTKKSADAILKQIKEIREQMPADPFEAELLMMAEAVATADQSESDTSEDEEEEIEEAAAPLPAEPLKFQPNAELAPSASQPGELGEDMLQMALRMASEISEEPVLDLEDSLNPTPVQPITQEGAAEFSTIDQSSDLLTNSPREALRGRRGRRVRSTRGRPKRPVVAAQEPAVIEPKPAADANMVLKYTYGVNAWKHWVAQKNLTLEKMANNKGKVKLFKTDILACTTEELNYSLCLFVKEVRKPNGEEYAPDSIFYLCLGIQQYLYENGRIDDIFSSFYYEGFTDALNEVLSGYEIRLNAHGLLVCRIEEEHLWESKQLGAHSPYILLNTLIYFNTKYFFLKTPEEHLRLSFSHIMKHWKRANGQPVAAKQPTQGQAKNVYLRYYAPTPAGPPEPGQKRKREETPVYEQAENTENPLRCPVKLYEFYLSKCPESIKHRNDVFYLLPERSCVPDSPVWYSTNALSLETMTKMLNRLRLVREIQEAHLHNAPHYGI